MSTPYLPGIPHRHSIDNPYTRTDPSNGHSQPSTLTSPPLHSTSFNNSTGSSYDTQGRRTSTDSDIRARQPSSNSSNGPTPSSPDRPSGVFSSTRKLLKKNSRTNSNSSSLPAQSTSLNYSPPLSNPLPSPSPYMKPYPSQPAYPSPYPSYHGPPIPPPGAAPRLDHRSSSNSSFRNFPPSQAQESEEEQLARIRQESLEYEQQRQINLEAEEERRLQQALDESAAIAEQDRIRAEERERLRRMEEEIAMREALVYSREFEQAEAERIAREERKRTLEEEKEVQRVLARSRTVVREGESSRQQERRENEALEAASRLSLEDGPRWENEGIGRHAEAQQDWTRRESEATTFGTVTDNSTRQDPNPELMRPPLPSTSQSSFVVTNPDRSASSLSESDEEGPPPSYTLVADDSISTTPSPLPPSGAAPSQHPRHISTGYAPYDIEAARAETYEQLDPSPSLGRTASTVASVGVHQSLDTSSPSPLNSIAAEDSAADSRGTEEDSQDPFDDSFAAEEEEETTNEDATRPNQAIVTEASVQQLLPQPPIVIATSPSQGSGSNPASPLHAPFPPLDGLSPAPTSLVRRLSEPSPSVPALLPPSATPPSTSHSANNTPEPSPSLDAYPNAPSFGGIVEDAGKSTLSTAEYVLDGVRWGFVPVERASLHPPLDSKGPFPRGAQLSTSTNEEGKQAFLSFAIEAKSWDSLLVFLLWSVESRLSHPARILTLFRDNRNRFGKSRFEASPHDHGADETGQGHQISVRIEFFRSFLDSSCRVRCRLELLPIVRSRPMSSATTSLNGSTAETTPAFDDDCPNVHILLSSRPHLPLNLANLASLLTGALAHSRQDRQSRCLSEAVEFLRNLNGERKAAQYGNGNDSDDEIGFRDRLKARLRKKKVRVIRTESQQSDRHSVLPDGAMLITPFSPDD
ncbi:uncharacterized protein JCM6883_004168 [Sporobolomyces salmoneus]|uniref:uncharacterized protein n=1 Tax=Sporobolomyces salmoneus TaxID=183962 RepID=UPI00317CF82B